MHEGDIGEQHQGEIILLITIIEQYNSPIHEWTDKFWMRWNGQRLKTPHRQVLNIKFQMDQQRFFDPTMSLTIDSMQKTQLKALFPTIRLDSSRANCQNIDGIFSESFEFWDQNCSHFSHNRVTFDWRCQGQKCLKRVISWWWKCDQRTWESEFDWICDWNFTIIWISFQTADGEISWRIRTRLRGRCSR